MSRIRTDLHFENCSADNFEDINTLLELYLDELDSWQREVDNIRIMHHDVWKGSRLSPLIKQHRAGSRVEKQTRILPTGGQTDVDYMFEVTGIEVRCNEHQGSIYFKSCACQDPGSRKSNMCNTYGRIYVCKSYKLFLESHDVYAKIFADALSFDEKEDAFLLIPAKFKENVVKNCGLDYQRNEILSSPISPSISGQGALNEYDGVPCLKLSSWPQVAMIWVNRQKESGLCFHGEWKSEIAQRAPLFLVPTGNPMDDEQHLQFRLSFSMVEIACFEQISPPMRKMFGIVKYLFKAMFSGSNLLSSYHVKTLMLWKIDQIPLDDWETMKTTDFIKGMMSEIRQTLRTSNIPHFFVENCNIFPVHKVTEQNVLEYTTIFQNLPQRLKENVGMLLSQDLNIPHSEMCLNLSAIKLQDVHKTRLDAYISGYLTRLLSVITFSITENYTVSCQMGEDSVKEMKRIFANYDNDRHISRIIPMVNSNIRRLKLCPKLIRSRVSFESNSSSKDKMSRLVHEAFEAYTNEDRLVAKDYIRKADSLRQSPDTTEGIGISVTKHHKCLHNDKPILNIIHFLENENNGRCPRFYLAPELLLQHMKMQLQMSSLIINAAALQEEIGKLHTIVEKLSLKEPYLGRLSYRFAGVYLLKGYRRFVCDEQLPVRVPIPLDEFDQRRFATNFNLR